MPSINKVILLSRLNTMPVYNLLPSGNKVVRLLVGTMTVDKAAERHRILLCGRMGDFAMKNLVPDMQVYVEGHL